MGAAGVEGEWVSLVFLMGQREVEALLIRKSCLVKSCLVIAVCLEVLFVCVSEW